ncbi:MAG: peptidyl-dipeptidase, partial [Alphaproteobacteria bacterium]
MMGKTSLLVITVMLAGCSVEADKTSTAEDARDFVAAVEADFAEKSEFAARAFWIQANFMTVDTNAVVAKVSADMTALAVKYANEAKQFNDLELDPTLRRKMEMIKLGITLPAPSNAAENKELATIAADLDSMYATGKGPHGRNLGELSRVMATSSDPAELLKAWQAWRTISPAMKAKYARMVEIANKGANELGYSDVGYMWRAGYDMPANDFRAEADR